MRFEDAQKIAGTVLTRETPYSPDEPDKYEYPVPSQANRRLYRRYREMARAESGTLICGRLGEYRYYDMDQAICRAMTLARTILATSKPQIPFTPGAPHFRLPISRPPKANCDAPCPCFASSGTHEQ